MTETSAQLTPAWTWYEKIAFRFFFIFLLFHAEPWTWISRVPFIGDALDFISEHYYRFFEWLVSLVKRDILDTDIVIAQSGSGDSLDSWVVYTLIPIIAAVGCLIWTLLDYRRREYNFLSTWLQVIIRYYLSMTMFIYGFIKLFPMQMSVPSLSQLVTPLGELSPMRLAWLFIGASPAYEIFSGCCEILGALLLLWRRTSSLGALILVGVLGHVVALNFFFDIPVKLYSAMLLVMSIYLLVPNIRQYWAFFILHRQVQLTFPTLNLQKKWHRVTRVVLKGILILSICVTPFYENMTAYNNGAAGNGPETGVIRGFFDVEDFRVNGKELAYTDENRWENVVFENWNGGSVRTGAPHGQLSRYGRAYFDYTPDTTSKMVRFKFRRNGVSKYALRYTNLDKDHVLLTGRKDSDSLYVLLRKNNTDHFGLLKPIKWVHNSVP